MDIQLVLFNGFGLSIERRKFAPFWGDFDEGGFDIYYHSGVEIKIGFLGIKLGTFYDSEEIMEELGDN